MFNAGVFIAFLYKIGPSLPRPSAGLRGAANARPLAIQGNCNQGHGSLSGTFIEGPSLERIRVFFITFHTHAERIQDRHWHCCALAIGACVRAPCLAKRRARKADAPDSVFDDFRSPSELGSLSIAALPQAREGRCNQNRDLALLSPLCKLAPARPSCSEVPLRQLSGISSSPEPGDEAGCCCGGTTCVGTIIGCICAAGRVIPGEATPAGGGGGA